MVTQKNERAIEYDACEPRLLIQAKIIVVVVPRASPVRYKVHLNFILSLPYTVFITYAWVRNARSTPHQKIDPRYGKIYTGVPEFAMYLFFNSRSFQ